MPTAEATKAIETWYASSKPSESQTSPERSHSFISSVVQSMMELHTADATATLSSMSSLYGPMARSSVV